MNITNKVKELLPGIQDDVIKDYDQNGVPNNIKFKGKMTGKLLKLVYPKGPKINLSEICNISEIDRHFSIFSKKRSNLNYSDTSSEEIILDLSQYGRNKGNQSKVRNNKKKTRSRVKNKKNKRNKPQKRRMPVTHSSDEEVGSSTDAEIEQIRESKKPKRKKRKIHKQNTNNKDTHSSSNDCVIESTNTGSSKRKHSKRERKLTPNSYTDIISSSSKSSKYTKKTKKTKSKPNGLQFKIGGTAKISQIPVIITVGATILRKCRFGCPVIDNCKDDKLGYTNVPKHVNYHQFHDKQDYGFPMQSISGKCTMHKETLFTTKNVLISHFYPTGKCKGLLIPALPKQEILPKNLQEWKTENQAVRKQMRKEMRDQKRNNT